MSFCCVYKSDYTREEKRIAFTKKITFCLFSERAVGELRQRRTQSMFFLYFALSFELTELVLSSIFFSLSISSSLLIFLIYFLSCFFFLLLVFTIFFIRDRFSTSIIFFSIFFLFEKSIFFFLWLLFKT